jgi:DNA-binding LytR/AlgR family response regulator
MLSAIAIDDEPIALEVIAHLCAKIPFIDLKATFTNAFEAIELLRNEKIDLMFLDIKMPDISGIDFLKSIPAPPMTIFTTAYSEHAVQSFELDVIDYLLKPFSLVRFLKACNKAHDQHELKNKSGIDLTDTSIYIKSGYEQVRIELANVLYAEGSGNYVQFILEDRKILSRLSMAEATDLLPASRFIRIHRSYIAAKKHILKIDKKTVWIKNRQLPVGAAYLPAVEKMIIG